MSELLLYQTNNQTTAQMQQKIIRQSGSFNYELKANQSAKKIISFNVPYTEKPFVCTTLSVLSGEPTSQYAVLGVIDNKSFTVHITNNDVVDCKCSVNWIAINQNNFSL